MGMAARVLMKAVLVSASYADDIIVSMIFQIMSMVPLSGGDGWDGLIRRLDFLLRKKKPTAHDQALGSVRYEVSELIQRCILLAMY